MGWSWLTTLIFGVVFMGALCFGEVILRICFWLGLGAKVQQHIMHALMWVLLVVLKMVGMRLSMTWNGYKFDKSRPLIIISNHQSLFDIPIKFWYFRRHHAKFVAKKELGKGAPSVSFHLRHGNHALIDRKDRERATKAIAKMGQFVEQNKNAAIIYPEGSRSRDGKLREFKVVGVSTLLANIPTALVVPVAIENSWKLVRWGFMPIPFGIKCKISILQPIEPQGLSAQEVLDYCEAKIRAQIGQI